MRRAVPRFLAVLAVAFLVTAPILAAAQPTVLPTAPSSAPAISGPEVDGFATFFWSAIALPFLAGAAKLAVDLVLRWMESKGVKQAAALRRAYNLADDVIGYVDAKTRSARDRALAPDSPGGAKVTKEEARELQALAVQAARQWLGEGGLEKLAKEAGIAASSAGEWIQGVIEQRFNLKKIAETAAEPPVVGFGTPVDSKGLAGVTASPQ